MISTLLLSRVILLHVAYPTLHLLCKTLSSLLAKNSLLGLGLALPLLSDSMVGFFSVTSIFDGERKGESPERHHNYFTALLTLETLFLFHIVHLPRPYVILYSVKLPGLRSTLSRDWTVVTVVTMVPSGMMVRSTSTFLVGVSEERSGKALWALQPSSVSPYRNWRSQKKKRKTMDLCMESNTPTFKWALLI